MLFNLFCATAADIDVLLSLCYATAADVDVQQASAMLQDMLAEVVNGSDVASALAGLLEEETPTLAELRHGSKLTQSAVPLPTDQQSVPDNSSSGASTDTHPQDQTHSELSDKSEVESKPALQQQTEDRLDVAETSDGDDMTDRVLQQPEFQAFAEFVLESACFSLLQESAADRWQAPDESLR